jgi:hypothetical protein
MRFLEQAQMASMLRNYERVYDWSMIGEQKWFEDNDLLNI